MYNNANTESVSKVFDDWQDRCYKDLLATFQKLLEAKDLETQHLREKLAEISTDPCFGTVRVTGNWEDRFLLLTAKKCILYDKLYDELSPHEKLNLYGSILLKFSSMPQVSRKKLQELKSHGNLTQEQAEIYYSINKFCSYISSQNKNW